MKNKILLPGSTEQIKYLQKEIDLSNKKVLIVGSGSEFVFDFIKDKVSLPVDIIVEDYDSLINSKILLNETKDVRVRLMSFENTDFSDSSFDLIYAQASISTTNRNKIIKHFKRLLKPGGILCIGEIVKLDEKTPVFVNNIWANNNLLPLSKNQLDSYYEERSFTNIKYKDFSYTLKSFYTNILKELNASLETLADNEKSYYKKLLNRMSHESKAYLKQGADKYIGFYVLIMELNK